MFTPIKVTKVDTFSIEYFPAYCKLLKNKKVPYGAIEVDKIPELLVFYERPHQQSETGTYLSLDSSYRVAYYPNYPPMKIKKSGRYNTANWSNLSLDQCFEKNADYIAGKISEVPYHAFGPLYDDHKFSNSLYLINKYHRVFTFAGQSNGIDLYYNSSEGNCIEIRRSYLSFLIEIEKSNSLEEFLKKECIVMRPEYGKPRNDYELAVTLINGELDCPIVETWDNNLNINFDPTKWCMFKVINKSWNSELLIEDLILEWFYKN